MVSLRRRRLLGLCSGNSSFVTPLPLYCENLIAYEQSTQRAKLKSSNPVASDDTSILDSNTVVKEEPGSSNASGSSPSKEQPSEQVSGPPIKRRKRHRRKNSHNQEACLMRGVYFKNMKWQAAIKVDKKQIHLGTVSSQEEAAHLYDRAAFMCGREPNFELPEPEKRELRKFKWEEFLAMTRQAITSKKHKRKIGPGSRRSELPPVPKHEWDSKQGASGSSACEDVEQELSVP
ncbi:ethylene-responsive transcription factor-like protein At4g13040 [Neltuma alba]|uniref:ethylene-responsive transcription factor-like protein At4g13040 n=1 Tax=Neltuma alba TaxID=207710 RepID=UPI0010A3AB52|nr:ethylene-responsive transcription factor-like protein At4g13040 [Prosopis alba]